MLKKLCVESAEVLLRDKLVDAPLDHFVQRLHVILDSFNFALGFLLLRISKSELLM